MLNCKTTIAIRELISKSRRTGARIGFVPTMGYLHEGHISLVRQAKTLCDLVVVSIFVNPTQFNDKKDFEKYPIDIERDTALLKAAGADALFLPQVEEIYPAGFQSWVELDGLTKRWEGEFRPGHFRGVSTVVSILFNCVKPDVALFGEKDFQQLRIIERMVKDLNFGIEIVRGKTVRESNGLAMSSRNVRLSPEGREIAANIFRALSKGKDAYNSGMRDPKALSATIKAHLENFKQIAPEYVAVVDEETLEEQNPVSYAARAIIAAKLEGVRLIDNLAL